MLHFQCSEMNLKGSYSVTLQAMGCLLGSVQIVGGLMWSLAVADKLGFDVVGSRGSRGIIRLGQKCAMLSCVCRVLSSAEAAWQA